MQRTPWASPAQAVKPQTAPSTHSCATRWRGDCPSLHTPPRDREQSSTRPLHTCAGAPPALPQPARRTRTPPRSPGALFQCHAHRTRLPVSCKVQVAAVTLYIARVSALRAALSLTTWPPRRAIAARRTLPHPLAPLDIDHGPIKPRARTRRCSAEQPGQTPMPCLPPTLYRRAANQLAPR